MARRYFKCPIEAAYMANNFGVVCYIKLLLNDKIYDKFAVKDWGREFFFPENYFYYVFKESEHIFKLKEGDIVSDGELFGELFSKSPYQDVSAFRIDDEGQTRTAKNSDLKIITRGNKNFFMGEIEND